MTHGLIVKDTSGNVAKITPSVPVIIAAGARYAPNELKKDDRYGVDVNLLGNDSVNHADVGVLIDRSKEANLDVHGIFTTGGNTYMWSWYMGGPLAFNYYTRNESTGVMSVWTPGDHSALNKYDELMAVYPDAFWDKLGGAEFTNIRLFSSMLHHVYYAGTTWTNVFGLGRDGVEGIDFAVYMRYYKGGKNYIQD